MERLHAFADDALGEHDAVGLAGELRAGRISAVEAVDAAIARTEAVNPTLGGLAYAAFDRARARAAAPYPYGGFFDGVPTFIKDNVEAAGMPTAEGADAWEPRAGDSDGDFARVYLATGLIPLGKSQLSEFGFSPSAEHPRLGPIRNPWNPDHISGASSAGSAVFVATGAVPIAHANDGGGSIRIPAGCNGLVGLKPTRDRLPLDTMPRKMPVHIVHNGVLTRSVRDTAAFYREAERAWRNPKLRPIGDVTDPIKRRLRIAVVTQSVGREPSPEVCELTCKTAALVEGLGHRVEHVAPPVPAYFPDDFLRYWALLAMITVRTGKKTFGETFDASRLDNLTLGLAANARRNLLRMPLSVARLGASKWVSARFFRNFDVVLMPTVGTETPRVGYFDPTADYQQIIDRIMEWVIFTPMQNATGDPAISLPLAETAGGLPLGMMFSARAGDDATLLELAYELEAAHPWRRIQG